MAQPGNVFVLSAPSGTGKSTLANRLIWDLPDLILSVPLWIISAFKALS